MNTTILGIDIGKSKFHVSLLGEAYKPHTKAFANCIEGFASLEHRHIRALWQCARDGSVCGLDPCRARIGNFAPWQDPVVQDWQCTTAKGIYCHSSNKPD